MFSFFCCSLFCFCVKTTKWHGKRAQNGNKMWKRSRKTLSASISIIILLNGLMAIGNQTAASQSLQKTTKIMPTLSLSITLNLEDRFLLRRAFLHKFGLEMLIGNASVNEYRGEHKVPRHIWALYERQNANPEAENIRHYTVSSQLQQDGIVWLLFNLSATGRSAKKERILRAELQLPKVKETKGMMLHKVGEIRETPGSRGGIELNESDGSAVEVANLLTKQPTEEEQLVLAWSLPRGSDPLAVELLESITLTVFTNSEKYDAVMETNWQESNKTKRRLKRSATSSSQQINWASGSNNEEDASANWSSSSGRRRKHRTHRKAGKGQQQQCRRMGLYVDFRELNWDDWIIAPVGYEAYQCRGRCAHPLPAKLNTTNHAIVQSLIHSLDPDSVPAPSCVPVQMSAISILYKDINSIVVVKTYADMRVDACGCH